MAVEYHVLNLGAGVQSTTVFLLFRSGIIPCPDGLVAVFADTQEEPQAVYDHLAWLRSLEWPRISMVTVGRLGDDLMRGRNSTGQRFAAIPAFTRAGGRIGRTRRQCSKEYKTEPIERHIRRDIVGLAPKHALPKDTAVHQYFGISRDESRRAVRVKEHVECRRGWYAHFPLLELGWTRGDCLRWLKDQVPHEVPRSACVFCPLKSDAEFLRLKNTDPAGWARAVEVDRALRTTGAVANRDMRQTMFIHRSATPLETADLNEGQGTLGFTTECVGLCGV